MGVPAPVEAQGRAQYSQDGGPRTVAAPPLLPVRAKAACTRPGGS